LVLDLDGDGLEISPLSKGIMFDSNAANSKTGSAWIGADDGLVVWDRNGNGLIDSGRELFGDETILATGPNAGHKASDGFTALADLDNDVNGVADGKFDASDVQFADVRIWRDLNQDGISQADELQTLADSGVQNIQLANATPVNIRYTDAQLVKTGTFTRVDGSTSQAGSFILAQNNFVRAFPAIAISDAAKALPGVEGTGWVRDLQEAATLNPDLIADVAQAKNATTKAGYKDAVGTLLRDWANSSDYNNASKQALAAGYGLILSDPQDAQMALLDEVITAWGNTSTRVAGLVEIATKNVAVYAGDTGSAATFTCESTALPQSSVRTPCNPSLRQYGSRCARSGSSRRVLRHQYTCGAGQTQTTNLLATNP
jgi:hypothetical protein